MRAAERVTDIERQAAPGSLNNEHRALMARVAETRDREAFKALFLFYGPRVKALMLRAGADHAQAEDIAQDVMMTVWRKVELYSPGRGNVGTWIYTVARNARIDRLRRSSSRPYDDIDDIELASDDADAEENAQAAQQADLVAGALRTLPREQRQIIEYAFIHDLPQSQIAERLSLPLGTVKSRMRLAYAKLRTRLEEMK